MSTTTTDPHNDPFSNTYNPGWRNHPNFAYANNSNTLGFQQGRSQSQPPSAPQKPDLEVIIGKFMEAAQASLQENEASIRNIEIQMGQLASQLHRQPEGNFPSDTDDPWKNQFEQCKVVILRNGRELEEAALRPKKVPVAPVIKSQDVKSLTRKLSHHERSR